MSAGKPLLGACGLALALLTGAASGCEDPPSDDGAVRIGLLLSYTGSLASNSINSERAVVMAIEAANAAGRLEGRRFRVLARDTRSDPNKVEGPANELLDGGAAVLIGPDFSDFLTQLRPLLRERTVLLPSYATASDIEYKPASWFVMGPSISRVACELMGQARADGRHRAIQIVSTGSYNGSLSFVLTNTYSLPKTVLSSDQAANPTDLAQLQRAMLDSDAYLLAAPPETASSLFYALIALGALDDPSRWYLSPTLHNPAFLESIPKGILDGAHGVSTGTVAGAADFRVAFQARWQEAPLHDAYAFYDAAAIAALAIRRALRVEQAIPPGTGLSRHLVAVTKAGGVPVKWNELDRGFELLQSGEEIEYVGLTGQLQFDSVGKTQTTTTKWWTIGQEGFVDVPHGTSCR
jgi:branched-chain amino acid transport system substrate-binding protein